MGRRRVNRRQNPSRATSETVVNDDFSSDSESGSPVNVARSETLTLGSMHDSPVRTRNRISFLIFISPIEENSSVRREPGSNSVDDAESRQQISHDTTPNDVIQLPMTLDHKRHIGRKILLKAQGNPHNLEPLI